MFQTINFPRQRHKITRQNTQLLKELAGSVKIPEHYKNKSFDLIINEAKTKYFTNKMVDYLEFATFDKKITRLLKK
ncbi:MAG: hypothetical protein Q7R95_09020 [bacterium]|nr:hypothetical protein [bacterium]